MDKALINIKDQVMFTEEWYPVASGLVILCEYLALIVERLEKLEAASKEKTTDDAND